MGWESRRFGRYSDYATEEYVSSSDRWKRIFCLVQNAHTSCESLSASFESVVGATSSWENGRGLKVITHFKLLQRLRISGEISPLHHVFNVCTGTNLSLLHRLAYLRLEFLATCCATFPLLDTSDEVQILYVPAILHCMLNGQSYFLTMVICIILGISGRQAYSSV
jgi:hypothetical protein